MATTDHGSSERSLPNKSHQLLNFPFSQKGNLDKRLSQREAVNRHGLSSGFGYSI